MKRIAWLTDIHLNFVDSEKIDVFLDQVRGAVPDAVLIGGDIGEAQNVLPYLERIDDRLRLPVYFVLGNHDFYNGSITRVRSHVGQLCRERERLTYLTTTEVVELTSEVGLIGHDGWADGRIGEYERSLIMLNDYRLIEELAGESKMSRWPLLKQLGDQAADHIRDALTRALKMFLHVYLLTHVPPMREACWHDGRLSDDEWAPHFSCKAMGDVILDVMRDHPDQQLTVLCGHTHGEGETRPLENVLILTGGAVYGEPAVTRCFDLP